MNDRIIVWNQGLTSYPVSKDLTEDPSLLALWNLKIGAKFLYLCTTPLLIFSRWRWHQKNRFHGANAYQNIINVKRSVTISGIRMASYFSAQNDDKACARRQLDFKGAIVGHV